jgi:5-(carboxyamino)imidazole ribonucleotide synthase
MIRPGATIGILGGGQLGRMVAMAARTMGYRVVVLDPDPRCAAAGVVDDVVVGQFHDAAAAADLARRCDVVTLEIEKLDPAVLASAAAYAPVRPGSDVLWPIQDRGRQKQWLTDHGLPVGAWHLAEDAAALKAAVAAFGASFAKSCHGGYDGRGQLEVTTETVDGAWEALGGRPVVVEQAIDLDFELSVLVARSPSGEVAVYPPAINHHVNRVLAWSAIPGEIEPRLHETAKQLARTIADGLKLEGLVAVELFATRDGRLLVNELAPRTHNSYHASDRACETSQFEQQVRAVCDLPLGSTAIVQPAAIANLLGDLWRDGEPPFEAALALPTVRLHLYGKTPRPGRKVGHLSATGASVDEAIARVRSAWNALQPA